MPLRVEEVNATVKRRKRDINGKTIGIYKKTRFLLRGYTKLILLMAPMKD